jgi:hypothetical protein
MKKKTKKEITSIQLLKNRYMNPICPFCKNKMQIETFNGYYESFSYWACNCNDDVLKSKSKINISGCYA